MPVTYTKGRAILSQFADEIMKLFEESPAHGSVSFTVTLYNNTPTRFVSGIEVSHLAGSTDGR